MQGISVNFEQPIKLLLFLVEELNINVKKSLSKFSMNLPFYNKNTVSSSITTSRYFLLPWEVSDNKYSSMKIYSI